jgi:hypothetical protein
MDLRGRHSFLSCDVNAHDDVTFLLTPFVHPVVLFTPTQGRMKYQIFNSSNQGKIFLANFFPFSFPFSFSRPTTEGLGSGNEIGVDK